MQAANVIHLADRRPGATPSDLLRIGSRVHCALYGGRAGIVFQVHGAQSPASIRRLGQGITSGGSAMFDVVWEDGALSPRVPECIIRGVQWRILPGLAAAEEIRAALEFHRSESDRRQREKEAAARQRELDREGVREQFPDLQPKGDTGGVEAAKNVRIELKRAFPRAKFSVRAEYDSIRIRWTDGPTVKQVEAVTGKYQEGSFNGMEDIYEYHTSAFNDVFGGCRYVSEDREYSDQAVADGIDGAFEKYVGNLRGIAKPTVEDFRRGRLWSVQVPGLGDDLQRLVYECLNQTCY